MLCTLAAVGYAAFGSHLENTLLSRTQPQALASGWRARTTAGLLDLREPSRPAAGSRGVTLRLENTLPASLPGSSCLAFQTKNESVRVWVNGTLVYTYGQEPQEVFGHGVGAVWNIASLPEAAAGQTLAVELVPIGGRTGLAPYRFLLGSRDCLVNSLLFESWGQLSVSVLLTLLSLSGLIGSLVAALKRDQRAAPVFHFSLFVLLSAIWMATDSGLLQFMTPNKGVSYLLFGCSFYLFCSPFSLFMADMIPEHKRLFLGFSIVSSLYAGLRIALYMAGAMDFEAWLVILHLLMAALILTCNAVLWRPVFQTGHLQRRSLTLAVTAFVLTEGAALVSFNLEDRMNLQRNGYSSGFYIGILLFVVIVAAGVIRRNHQMQQQAFKAAFFERRAYTDDLTGLLTAKGFDDKLAALLLSAPAERHYAVVDFDVNFFSQYNANNGLEKGDHLLQEIAGTLAGFCREGELCARQEADHFVCAAYGSSLAEIMDRLRAVSQRARSRMDSQRLLLSYGVTEVQDRSLSPATLRNQALVAKRTVKGNYEQNIAVYDRALHEAQLREMELLSGFESSLANQEYVIYLQPKIHAWTEKLSGAEALVRRLAPDGSVLSAGPIIEALESKGFVGKLDFHILDLVCQFQRRCLDEGRQVCPISSNFSRVHLYDPDFPAHVARIVDRYRLSHCLIEIELTETAFLAGKDSLSATVRQLHEYGFQVSIDDFGSGYSSLNMLKDVEADIIKLDREFLAGCTDLSRAGAVIRHTLRLAQEMKITCVAEGVETAQQLAFLRELGCDLIQGFYFSHPLPREDFIQKYLPVVCPPASVV